MIHFIHNIGDYFASNYFDDDFSKKVIEKSGYDADAIKQLTQDIARLKPEYFKLKQKFIENHLRTKDKINLSHAFHSLVLNALGYDTSYSQYNELFPISDKSVLPVRHILYRGDEIHLMVMEMHALIKTGEEEPDGLFEQSYNVDHEEEATAKAQKYHRSQWADVFSVPDGLSISPMIINEAINTLFLLPKHRRPKFILLCGGNQYFLLEAEKWFRGSYLQLDLEALFDDATVQKDYYAVFYLLLGKDLLAPTAEMVLMEQLDEDAHKAAYEVTQDLKAGVIHAVECLANETVQYLKQQGVDYHEIDANDLKNDCLNMVYRLLFLFYAEAREDLDILPSNDEVYERGYSLEMLRDLELVPLVTESSINGYFFHDSLFRLFDLLNKGYREEDGASKTFKIRHLDSPMFDGAELHYLNRVRIRNLVWQDVICELSLSKKQRGKNRGRISYANLGINQLGAVYESLLAFRGFLAETDYIEVHRKKKKGETSEKVARTEGSYLVPRHRFEDFHQDEIFYIEKEGAKNELKVISQGSFIYRLSGRDRQKSASYYTPEALTKTTVKYTLKPILERLDKGELKATDLLKLKILEPAMGAAAFHNEVINQLSQAYLAYRQEELNRKVDPNHYQQELQKIKAYIALNNVYGVDINPTAIELGKLSLWLNVIHEKMQTPFFGYRLGLGNAVVGSWLKVFKHKEFSFEPKGQRGFEKKEWWNTPPKGLKFGKKGILRKEDEIYHFLLPDEGMVSSAGIKLLKDAYPDEAKRVNEWRKTFCEPIRQDEYALLQQIARAIDVLLLEHYEIQKNIGLITEANTEFFGNVNTTLNLNFHDYSYEQKARLARERLQPNAPYYKLKQIMDYWCSLWFWDVRDAADLPSRRQWHEDLLQTLNIDLAVNSPREDHDDEVALLNYRKDKKQLEKELVDALKQSTFSLFANERAELVKRYADQYRFFHYELEFIEIFRENNGFDIAVGNPPWNQIEFDEEGVLIDLDPKVVLGGITENARLAYYQSPVYISESIYYESLKSHVRSKNNFKYNDSTKSNLYKLFYESILNIANTVGLIHDRGIFSDAKGDELRQRAYESLLYLFRFNNELLLFQEVGNAKKFEISILARNKPGIDFKVISNLFHPATIDNCFINNDTRVLNLKDENGNWETRGNLDRIVDINEYELKVLKSVDPEDVVPKLPYIQSKTFFNIQKKLNSYPLKLSDLSDHITCTQMLNETEGEKKRQIKLQPGKVDLEHLVYNGPNIYCGNPISQTPNKSANNHRDYSSIQNQFLQPSELPITKYVLVDRHQLEIPMDFYHVHRRRAINTNERTFITAILPPHLAHLRSCYSINFSDQTKMLAFSCASISIVYDYLMRSSGKEDFVYHVIKQLPLLSESKFIPDIIIRGALLNCRTTYYAALWNYVHAKFKPRYPFSEIIDTSYVLDSFLCDWDFYKLHIPDLVRRKIEIEIDVLVSMALDLTLQELVAIYETDFSVLKFNENDTWYDSKGNIVFTCSKGLSSVGLDRSDWERIRDMKEDETYTHTITKSELYQGQQVTYYAPFGKCDRVADYKHAWTHFEHRFKTE